MLDEVVLITANGRYRYADDRILLVRIVHSDLRTGNASVAK